MLPSFTQLTTVAMLNHRSTDLLKIAYYEMGSGSNGTVLLLHGWPDDASTWKELMPAFEDAGYRVIAPFLRGFGKTTFINSHTPRAGNTGVHAFDMIGLMDQLGIDRFDVIGHDWGASIAENLVVNWPKRIRSLGLVSATPRLGGLSVLSFDQAKLDWYHWLQITRRGQQAVKADPIGFARYMWESWSPAGWYQESTFADVARSWANPDFVEITLHSYQSRWDEAPVDPESGALEEKVKRTERLNLPCIFIQGDADGVNPTETSKDVFKKFSGPFQRILLNGVGHFPTREAPQELTKHLINFLRQSSAT
jgi:pimeloyl-ACP methyl ester carboxylesterase